MVIGVKSTDESHLEIHDKKGIDNQLKKICTCESGWQHYESDRMTVKRGLINPDDIGICQINQTHWANAVNRLGVDLFTETGNIEMAMWIYKNHGTWPWNWSKHCWNN